MNRILQKLCSIATMRKCSCCVVVLRPGSPDKVISSRSDNQLTLFLGRLKPPKRFKPFLNQQNGEIGRKYINLQESYVAWMGFGHTIPGYADECTLELLILVQRIRVVSPTFPWTPLHYICDWFIFILHEGDGGRWRLIITGTLLFPCDRYPAFPMLWNKSSEKPGTSWEDNHHARLYKPEIEDFLWTVPKVIFYRRETGYRKKCKQTK